MEIRCQYWQSHKNSGSKYWTSVLVEWSLENRAILKVLAFIQTLLEKKGLAASNYQKKVANLSDFFL